MLIFYYVILLLLCSGDFLSSQNEDFFCGQNATAKQKIKMYKSDKNVRILYKIKTSGQTRCFLRGQNRLHEGSEKW